MTIAPYRVSHSHAIEEGKNEELRFSLRGGRVSIIVASRVSHVRYGHTAAIGQYSYIAVHSATMRTPPQPHLRT